MHNQIEDIDLYVAVKQSALLSQNNAYLLSLKIMIDAVNESEHFIAPKPFAHH